MKNKSVIVTGALGLIGKNICQELESKKYIVKKVDLSLGHDLTNEDFVKDYFLNNKADSIINLFSLNHHIDIGLKSTNLFNIDLNSFGSKI